MFSAFSAFFFWSCLFPTPPSHQFLSEMAPVLITGEWHGNWLDVFQWRWVIEISPDEDDDEQQLDNLLLSGSDPNQIKCNGSAGTKEVPESIGFCRWFEKKGGVLYPQKKPLPKRRQMIPPPLSPPPSPPFFLSAGHKRNKCSVAYTQHRFMRPFKQINHLDAPNGHFSIRVYFDCCWPTPTTTRRRRRRRRRSGEKVDGCQISGGVVWFSFDSWVAFQIRLRVRGRRDIV